jgi:hypothetical protein
MPLLARFTHHTRFIDEDDACLKAVARLIHSTNDGSSRYKQDVAQRLVRIGDPPDDSLSPQVARPELTAGSVPIGNSRSTHAAGAMHPQQHLC